MTDLDLHEKLSLRLGILLGYVEELRPYAGLTRAKLESDRDAALKVERLFELAAECVLDICRMVVSDQGYKIPEDSKGYILRLGKEGVLEAGFAEEFSGLAGFRNILVHDYLEIDYKEVADKLNRLGDFERFAKEVAGFYELKTRS